MPGDSTSRVLVIAVPADAAVAQVIKDELTRRGLPCIPSSDEALEVGSFSAAVVVMSPASMLDLQWRRTADAARTLRIIPVVAAPLESNTVPPGFISELNWLFWDPTRVDEFTGLLVRSIATSVDEHRTQRSLESEALAWAGRGYSRDALIGSVARARAAQRLAAESGDELPTDRHHLVQSYAQHSLKYALKQRRANRWRWARTALVVTLLAIVPTILAAQQIRQANREAVLLGGALNNDGRPDLAVVKAAGLAQARPDLARVIVSSGVLASVYSASGLGVLAWDDLAAVNAVAFTNDLARTYVADGAGTVSLWDFPSGRVTDRVLVSDSPLYELSTSKDGRWVAASGPREVVHADAVKWDTTRWPTSSSASSVVVADDGGQVVAVVDGRAYQGVPSEPRLRARSSDEEKVLHVMASGADQILLLVRTGPVLQIRDASDGSTLRSVAFPPSEFEAGALSEGGRLMVVTGRDQQLWVGEGPHPLEPTGIAVPVPTSSLSVNNDGWVIIGSEQQGAQVWATDGPRHLGQVCQGQGRVDQIVLREAIGACMPSRRVFDLRQLGRTSPPSPDEISHVTGKSAPGTGGAVRGVVITESGDGFVWGVEEALTASPVAKKTTAAESPSMPPQTLFSAASVSPFGNTFAVGTRDGTVFEFDLWHSTEGDTWGITELGRFHLPPGESVRSLGYGKDGRKLYALSETDHWYERLSCADCTRGVGILRAARSLRLPAYPDELLGLLPEEVIGELDLHPMPVPPEPRSPR